MKTKVKNASKSSLSSRALLVSVQISQWTARKTDKTATDTVIKAHKTEKAAGGYTKRLLPNAAELEAVNAKAGEIRTYFYENTLPWMNDGQRIINAKHHMKFANDFRKMKNEFDKAVKEFVSAYPRLKTQAQKTLGNLYNEAEYPSPATMPDKFQCEVDYCPMPDVKDFRVEISDAEKKNFERKMKETEGAAMRNVWERLHGVVESAAKKLGESDAIFRDSLLGNIQDLCGMLPALNVSEDPKLSKMSEELQKTLSGYSLDTLRTDKKARSDAAKKLQEVTDKMGAFMGAPKK